MTMASFAAANMTFEKAIACKPSDTLYLRAGLALCAQYRCNKPDFVASRIKYYWQKLTPVNREKLSQVCMVFDCNWPPMDDGDRQH
jgi:hypothetical protein